MLRCYRQRLNNFFSQLSRVNLVPELEADVVCRGMRTDIVPALAVDKDSQTVSPSVPRLIAEHEMGIDSLSETKEWIQTQRQRLNGLIKEGSLQKVEALLQTSLHEIKTITEFHLGYCETVLSDIKEQPNTYRIFLKYLDHLQRRLKPLLQGSMRLFHPDHVINLTLSQAMWALINRYSQFYLAQSRYYLDKLKKYPLRIEEFYGSCQAKFPRHSAQEWLEITRRIEKLEKSVQDLEQSFKEFDHELKELKAQRAQDKVELVAKLKEVTVQWAQDNSDWVARRAQDKIEREAQWGRDQAKTEAQLKKIEIKFDQLNQFLAYSIEQPSQYTGCCRRRTHPT